MLHKEVMRNIKMLMIYRNVNYLQGGMNLRAKKLIIISVLSLLLVSAVFTAVNAGTTGKISGVITDKATGEPLPGVAVSVVGTARGALTNTNGEYNILNVPVGQYTLKAQLVGYASVEVADLSVSADLTSLYNFELTSLAIETGEVIRVTAERPLILQDQTASLNVIEKEEIQNMPTRGYQDVVGLSAGVVAFKDNPGVRQRGGTEATNEPTMNIRGGRTSDVAYYVDGFSQQDPLTGLSTTAINNNAIEEIQITTGGFNAEYGKVSSGIINVTTREGADAYAGNVETVTDNFHGESYDFNVYALDLSGPMPIMEDKMSFYVSGERRWQRDRNPTSGADGILPNNERDGWSWQGKLRYDVHPNAYLRVGVLGSVDKWQQYIHSYYFNQNHMPRYEDTNNSVYIKLNHTINEKMFHTLSVNYFMTERYRGDGVHFKDLMSYGRAEGNLRFEETTLFRPWDDLETEDIDEGYLFDDYMHRNSSYIGLNWDLTAQANSYNEIKVGAEYKRHSLRYYRHLFPQKLFYEDVISDDGTDTTTVLNEQAWLDVDNYGYYWDETGEHDLNSGWNSAKNPYEISLYLQDKFEWEGLIVNGGVRFDYFNSNTQRLKDAFYPLQGDGIEDQELTEADLEDAKGETQISPRLGVAYPVSDVTHFRFSYGKFFQAAELQNLYTSYDYLEYMTKVGPYFYPVANPNLESEETTAYEVGITHRLGEFTRLDVTAFYKDVKNLTDVITLPSSPIAYPTYRNVDFGTVKGIELNLKMRRNRNIALDFGYTLQFASGTGSFATTQYNVAWHNTETPKTVSPLEFDQRHKFTGVFDVRAGKGEGPKLGDFYVLENTGLNVVLNVASGTPYTAMEVYNEVTLASLTSSPSSTINSRYSPWTYNVDLKLNREFNLGKIRFDAYLWVLNVFDTENVVDVYESTGKPDNTGWLSTDPGQVFLETYADENELGYTGEELYNLAQNNPLNYGNPREVRLGLRLSF